MFVQTRISAICAVYALFLLPHTPASGDASYVDALRHFSQALETPGDLDPLVEAAAQKRLVLLGESTHGTLEYYEWRSIISQKLIADHDFSFIAVEGDWTALAPLDRYVRQLPGAPSSARDALMGIDRWPLWMWANETMVDLGEWLREWNDGRDYEERVGVHGIDVYGMWQSIYEVIAFFEEHYPDQADSVRQQYRILKPFAEDSTGYVMHIRSTNRDARRGVEAVAAKLRERYQEAGPDQRSRYFDAYQQARVVQAGEAHVRAMMHRGAASWNYRAGNFQQTVDRLLDYYGPSARGIVWAHNTHIGDARATTMAQQGQRNIGQDARASVGEDDVFAIGFGTASGQVLAGARWEGARQVMTIATPRADSLEGYFRQFAEKPVWLHFESDAGAPYHLLRSQPVLHRAIGVTYNPQQDRQHNYVPTALARRYEAFIYFPETRPLVPLHD